MDNNKNHSQKNPNTTAEGVKTGGANRITPKVIQQTSEVVPEKVLNQSSDKAKGLDGQNQTYHRSSPNAKRRIPDVIVAYDFIYRNTWEKVK